MVIASDIILRGSIWKQVADGYSNIFKERTHYDVFLMSVAIGVVYDKRKETVDDGSGVDISIPRNVFNGKSEPFDTLFQSAVLSTTTETFDDDTRLKIAFAPDERSESINRIQFLTQFANFGVEKLLELKGIDDIDTMEQLLNFIITTSEGSNFEINELKDEDVEEVLNES